MNFLNILVHFLLLIAIVKIMGEKNLDGGLGFGRKRPYMIYIWSLLEGLFWVLGGFGVGAWEGFSGSVLATGSR